MPFIVVVFHRFMSPDLSAPANKNTPGKDDSDADEEDADESGAEPPPPPPENEEEEGQATK